MGTVTICIFDNNKDLQLLSKLEGMALNAGQLLAPAKGFGLWPRLFSSQKMLIMLFWPILFHIWCSVVILVTFNSNFINFGNKEREEK